MAITGYDSLISALCNNQKRTIFYQKNASGVGIAANWYHCWTVGGNPGPGVFYTGTALQFQRTTEATAGALAHGGNRSPLIKSLISTWGAQSAASTLQIMLVDLVGYYPVTPSGALQTMDNSNGPNRYTTAGQGGLQAILVNGALTGASAANINSLTYVDQDGNTGISMPTDITVAVTVSAALPTTILGSRVLTAVGGSPFIPLAAGDSGMTSITDVTWSASNTGLHAFLMVRPLMSFPYYNVLFTGADKDLVNCVANFERIYDGACLSFLVFYAGTAGAILNGTFDVVWS